jgi:hypothetical protein
MRAVLVGVTVSILALIGGAIGADFGSAIVAEYKLSRALRSQANLAFDPWVSILGFPFVTQALRHSYGLIEFRANALKWPPVGKASLEATMHDVDTRQSSWLVRPTAALPVGELESRIIISSTELARYMGIKDLVVEPPPKETNDATGGTTESGISSSYGLVISGTPTIAGFDERVSVSADLSMAGPDATTLVIKATGIATSPDTPTTTKTKVPDDKLPDVLRAFTTDLPQQRLPFSVIPTREGARGNDIIIEGIAYGLTIHLDQFNQS